MPHFIVDCSENVLNIEPPAKILQSIHDTAEATGLFKKGDIKVRICAFKEDFYTVADSKNDFIHVFGNIMEGRNDTQKANLSQLIVKKLKEMFPNVPIISMNIREFEKANYCNRNMI